MTFPVRAALYPHQAEGAARTVEALRTTGAYALLYEMGCGKTLTAMAAMGRLFLDGDLTRVLIVAPASVCGVWKKDMERFADFPYLLRVLLGERRKREQMLGNLISADLDIRHYGLPAQLCVAVINYESAWRMEEQLAAFRPQLIICDESQRIKSRTAQQSKAMHRLGKLAKYRMILSGTPVQNSPLDVYSQFLFLKPDVFGTRWKPFEAHYAVMGTIYAPGGRAVQKAQGYKNLDELTAKVYAHAHRVTKAEALELPDKTFESRYVEMSPAEARAYREMQRESLVWLDEQNVVTAPIVITRMLRLQQITGGFLAAGDDAAVQLGTGKLDALREIIEDAVIDGGEKLVVFARFVPEVEAILALCEKLKVPAVGLWGEVPAAQRGDLVDAFQTDPGCKIFVAQIDTAGTGITLHAAHLAVFYSVNFNYATYQQATDRIHRIGMGDAPCHYIHLVAEGTIDEHVLEALTQKRDLADVVLDKHREIFDWRKKDGKS